MERPLVKIDSEFKGLIPPGSDYENTVKSLEESIAKEGCRDALVAWMPTDDPDAMTPILLDGHHRFEICTRLCIPFDIKLATWIQSRSEARVWIRNNQAGRRNLSLSQLGMLAAQNLDEESVWARGRQRSGGSKATLASIEAKVSSDTQSKKGKAVELQANKFGVSPGTVERAARVIRNAVPDVVAMVNAGELKLGTADEFAKLPRIEQEEAVAKGPKAVREAAAKIRSAPTAPLAPITPIRRSKEDEELDRKVALLTAKGHTTTEIARGLGVDPNKVSRSKSAQGLVRSDTNPLSSLLSEARSQAGGWELALDVSAASIDKASHSQRSELKTELDRLVKAARKMAASLVTMVEEVG
jgi:hypothetical protein